MKIPVTEHFDKMRSIGMLTLRDDVDIPEDAVFATAFRVSPDGKRTLVEVSLVHEPAVKRGSEHDHS